MLLVEQNARSALSVADHGVVLNLGRVVADDDASSPGRATTSSATPTSGSDRTRTRAHVQQFLNTALGGLTLGMVYAAFALALVLIWRSTRIVNFAQAPMAMVTTFVALVVIDAGYSYWLGSSRPCCCGLVLGAVLERVVVRPVEGKAEINAVILTLGLFIILHALAAVIFGNRYRSFPAPFGIRGLEVGDTTIALTGFGIFTIVAVLVVMAPAGRAVPLHRPRAADAGVGVQPGGGPTARRAGRPDADPGLGARLPGRLARRPADRRRQPGAPVLHGLRRGLRLRRRGAGRAGQPGRRGRRRRCSWASRSASSAGTSAPSWSRSPRS